MNNQSQPPLWPEEWLIRRLESTDRSDPRFESAWYGLHTALFSHYFPYQRRFLIKPQPKVREVYEEDISFSSTQAESSVVLDDSSDENSNVAADLSMTSMGCLVLPGAGTTHIPDFIVVKATQFASFDTPLLVAEVKVDEPMHESDWVKYQNQMDRYMDSLSKQIMAGAHLAGLLICGTKVKVFRLEGPESEVEMDEETYDINSEIISQLLQTIAKDNWDC